MNASEALVAARRFLADARNPDGGWGYLPGQGSAPEPTVLCAAAEAGFSATWLATADLGFGELLLPAALRATPDTDALRASAVEHLLALRSRPGAGGRDDANAEVKLDAQLIGWGWVDGTFGWVEPTSYAIISLKSAALGDDARVIEGLRLLRDRKCADGGWNYGNPVTMGRDLDADIAPTAWASLALGRDPAAESAFAVVLTALEHPSSLGLASALLAWTGRAEHLAPRHAQVQTLIDALVARQRDDGSFGGRVDWTALAVCALAAAEGAKPHVFAV